MASKTVTTQVIKVLRRNLQQAIKARQFDEAEALLMQLKDEDPLSLGTRGLELEYFVVAGQWSDAQILAEQLLRLFPQSARIQYLAGRIYYRIKNYRLALQYFEESNSLHWHWRALRWSGKTQTQLGQFEAAERILLGLVTEHVSINIDLAWLYERRNQVVRALEHIEVYLKKYPEDAFANVQRLRLVACTQEPDALSEDVDTLLELDEEVPAEMLPAYIQNLLESGQGHLVRKFVAEHSEQIDEQAAVALAWICHRLQAYDLAVSLFTKGLPSRLSDVKYLSALESAARHCNRVDELIEQYEVLAPDEKRLYGRVRSLKKRQGK